MPSTTLKQLETDIEKRIRRRKALRNKKQRLHQGREARREAHAVRSLRRRLDRVQELHALPRTQYDSVSVQNIPHDAKAAAYYVNGLYANEAEVKRQAPNAKYTSITVNTSAVADVLDVEVGDATIADCPGWYRKFKAARPKQKPIFYTSASNVDALVTTLKAAGITRDKYLIWTAHYIGPHFCGEGCEYAKSAGKVDATQYTTNNETLDVSLCRVSYWRR